MSNEKPAKEIDVESLDAELAAAKKMEENKNTVFGKTAAVFAFCMCIFQIATVFRQLNVIPQRGVHVAFAFTILFLSMPLYEHVFKDRFAGNAAFRGVCRAVDILCIIALWASIYMCNYEYDHLSDNFGRAGKWAAIAGCILLILVLEGTRRCLGYIMPTLAILFVLYARLGGYIPGRLGHRGYTFEAIFKYLAIDLDGIFGTTISVSAGVIFMFVMFGAFLEASGCSSFINNLAISVTGKLRCGPALSAVVASALMGCINGSAVANVVGTGTFTIPLMKSRGYKSDFAAGVESVASTGGQILPPVMGSGAFLMVVFTMEPYTAIVKAAVIPAVLYFLGAGIAVFAQGEVGDVELLPKDQIPKTRDVMKNGWKYLVVIGVLVWALLIEQFSPAYSGLLGCASVPVVMIFYLIIEYFWPKLTTPRKVLSVIGLLIWMMLIRLLHPAYFILIGCVSALCVIILFLIIRYLWAKFVKHSDPGWVGDLLGRIYHSEVKPIPKTFVKTGYSALSIVSGCACAGIVVAMVSRTGLGVVFGDAMIQAAGGNLFLSLLFTAIACVILGMGLPTTSAYVIGASILAPALAKLGLSALTAHLFVFYFACLSAITPPVALAAYAGAGIAKCDPMTTAIQACKIGFAGFIVPFVFCYNSAMMLNGTLPAILIVCGTALVGCIGMSCGMQGWYFSGQNRIPWFLRVLVIGAGLCMMIPSNLLSIVGLVILVALAVFERARTAKLQAA